MQDTQGLIALIHEAFRETEHPGDAFLQGSHERCEPAEVTAAFKGVMHWTQIDPSILDANYTALSFFSDGGFRHFLPAYLIADVYGRLQTADPVFHLTNGFFDHRVKGAGRVSYVRKGHWEIWVRESKAVWRDDLA